MFFQEKRDAMRLLVGLEDGQIDPDEVRQLAEGADPALVYLVFSWLRTRYHPGHSASEGVLGRVVSLLQESAETARIAKVGEKDSLSKWFEESYDFRELDREDFVSLVVEKLEG